MRVFWVSQAIRRAAIGPGNIKSDADVFIGVVAALNVHFDPDKSFSVTRSGAPCNRTFCVNDEFGRLMIQPECSSLKVIVLVERFHVLGYWL